MHNMLKKALKAQAHNLRPVVLMGAKGVTPQLIAEIDSALTTHELIKIKLMGEDKTDRKLIADQLCSATQAELVQIVGHIATVYRKKPE